MSNTIDTHRWVALVPTLFFVLLFAGCHDDPKWSWAERDMLELSQSQWPEASAEILYDEVQSIHRVWENPGTQTLLHRATRINSEAAIDDVGTLIQDVNPEFTDVVLFRGRVIQPDGSISYIDEDDLIRDETEFVDLLGQEKTRETYIARFPAVQVGSIVEYVMVFDSPRSYKKWQDPYVYGQYPTRYPIRRHRAELWIDKKLDVDLEGFNLRGADFQKADIGKFWRYTLAVDEIPPDEPEWRGPDGRARQAWWRFQTEQMFLEPGTVPMFKNWATASKRVATVLFIQKSFMGEFEDEWEPPEGCEGRACVEAAWNKTNEDVRLDSWGSVGSMRTLDVVVEDGWGSAWEKSVLLGQRLESAGFEVRYGIVNRSKANFFNKNVRLMDSFDHLVVRLPEQEGLEDEIWLDPSCEYCQLGQIPRWIHDTQTLVIRKYKDKFRARIMEARGAVPEPGVDRIQHEFRLEADGKATYTWTNREERQEAVQELMSERERLENTDWQEELRQGLERRHPDTRLLESPEAGYDRSNGVYKRVYTAILPNYAIPDRNELIVPLKLYEWDLDEDRNFDLIFQDEIHEDINIFEPPKGWQVVKDSLPAEREWTHPAGKVTIAAAVEDDGKVRITQRREYQRGNYSPEQYRQIRKALHNSDEVASRAILFRKR